MAGAGLRRRTHFQQKYDVPADGYDELYGEEQYRKYEAAFTELGKSIEELNVVVDVGCATGLLGEYLRARGFRGLYIGIDVSEDRLKAAKLKAGHSWEIIQADAEHLPLRAGSADLVTCITVIHLLDVDRAVEELMKVTGDMAIITLLERRIDLETEVLRSLSKSSIKKLSRPGVRDVVFIVRKYPSEPVAGLGTP